MMKKLTLTLIAPLVVSGCVTMESRFDRMMNGANPYEEPPFYARYLSSSNLDRRIQSTLDQLRANPRAAGLHNDLGTLLLEKGFPKDAEVEFRRAVAADHDLYAAWYNLGLIREARGDASGAEGAYRRTLSIKPGHPAAHFQLGLLNEKRGNQDAAIEHYAKAFDINRAMLDVRVNPRILDSKLVDRALIHNYDLAHTERSIHFQGTPTGYVSPAPIVKTEPAPSEPVERGTAPSPQPKPGSIVTPTAPATDPSQQNQPGVKPVEEKKMTRQERYEAARKQRESEQREAEAKRPVATPSTPPGFEILPNASATPR
jgi:tetratricopeptide (TPR) repeat protein